MNATHTHNITASGHNLREHLIEATGYDPVTEPSFAWSTVDACDTCGTHNSTAVTSADGDTFERLCFHCTIQR